ncbi:hypothetical protein B14911_11447 [Bacillus sp. NRRL B-14911]|uniref:Uncharacterized protein n=1 Tax=Bacillus infantis NRRL B-14911 TaxID=1367477 RepID=U5L7E9_9BACI|nr:hypothetical protein N288_09140 [Bacillus infantis NRRL B-14911]EAR64876.1 hypothetical protein B14911_11447 [Bacillus sp. NRRL B-14911]PLR71438.1 hypothetical protein CYJ37_16230 [Bacillus sp. UMB0728]
MENSFLDAGAALNAKKFPAILTRDGETNFHFKKTHKKKEVWNVSIPNLFTGMQVSGRPSF